MSAALGYLYRRGITISSFIRTTQRTTSRHGICPFCSSVPKIPLETGEETEEVQKKSNKSRVNRLNKHALSSEGEDVSLDSQLKTSLKPRAPKVQNNQTDHAVYIGPLFDKLEKGTVKAKKEKSTWSRTSKRQKKYTQLSDKVSDSVHEPSILGRMEGRKTKSMSQRTEFEFKIKSQYDKNLVTKETVDKSDASSDRYAQTLRKKIQTENSQGNIRIDPVENDSNFQVRRIGRENESYSGLQMQKESKSKREKQKFKKFHNRVMERDSQRHATKWHSDFKVVPVSIQHIDTNERNVQRPSEPDLPSSKFDKRKDSHFHNSKHIPNIEEDMTKTPNKIPSSSDTMKRNEKDAFSKWMNEIFHRKKTINSGREESSLSNNWQDAKSDLVKGKGKVGVTKDTVEGARKETKQQESFDGPHVVNDIMQVFRNTSKIYFPDKRRPAMNADDARKLFRYSEESPSGVTDLFQGREKDTVDYTSNRHLVGQLDMSNYERLDSDCVISSEQVKEASDFKNYDNDDGSGNRTRETFSTNLAVNEQFVHGESSKNSPAWFGHHFDTVKNTNTSYMLKPVFTNNVSVPLQQHNGPIETFERLTPSIDVDQLNSEALSATKPAESEENITKKRKKKTSKNEELESKLKLKKDRDKVKAFTSYLEVSIETDMFPVAMRDFKIYRDSKALDVTLEMYNILQRGIAFTKGDMKEMTSLFQMMRDDGIQPNMETYAYCISRIGRRKETILKYGPYILKDLEEQGLDITNVFSECELRLRDADSLHKFMQTLQPDVSLKPRFKTTKYSEPLTVGLNSPTQIIPADTSTCVKLDHVLKATETQMSRELRGMVSIPPVWQDDSTDDRQMEELFEKWKDVITTKLKEAVAKGKKGAWYTKAFNIYPYLCMFPEEEYVEILMDQAKALASMNPLYSPKLAYLQQDLGEVIFDRYKIHYNLKARSMKGLSVCYKEYLERSLKHYQTDINYRQTWQEISGNVSPYTPTTLSPFPWNKYLLREVGGFFLNILLDNLQVEFIHKGTRNTHNCFHVVVRNRSLKMTKEVKVHPQLVKICQFKTIMKNTSKVPMLIPPLPLLSPTFGGLLMNTSSLLKTKSERHDEWFKQLNPLPVLDSINILSNSAWVINKPVLDVVLQLFREGGSPDVGIPVHPDTLKPPEEKTRQLMGKFQKVYLEAQSLWFSEMYKLSVANMFRDEVFWFPYFVDFRCRNYPLPLFNHQGHDVTRGVLKFAESKPLGEEGLKWLKIHLVNLTGLKKKASLKDRHDYVDEIMDEIIDSADNPLTGRGWWRKSDEPIQTLAACMELMAAVRSTNPKTYMCNFPVHQDGSCNGLQHYAALGLDKEGAKFVNLQPCDYPTDVYSSVAEKIHMEIDEELAGNKATDEIPTIAKQYLERKTIKQSVMTQVYGVSRFGVHKQIKGQLQDTDCPPEKIHAVATYLTKKTFHSLATIFKAGKEIQTWFTRCAHAIGHSNQTVDWVTPLNFPIIQNYHVEDPRYSEELENERVNKSKQRNGFPPNFIHSLDATHMMLTALYCHREGIRFDAVHDSFWTHPSDVSIMNKVTREQFVALHKQPILENLSEFFLEHYDESLKDHPKYEEIMTLFMAVPKKGDFNLNLVKDSEYFFS